MQMVRLYRDKTRGKLKFNLIDIRYPLLQTETLCLY